MDAFMDKVKELAAKKSSDCLGHAHKSLVLAVRRRIIGKHLYGIHGIIAATVEKAFDRKGDAAMQVVLELV